MPDPGRRSILSLGILLAVLPTYALGKPHAPVVLFICEFGTAKSAIARELFRKRAGERGVAVSAFSRGLKIEDHVSPPLRARLDAEGIDSRRDGFAIVSDADLRRADVVVTFAALPATIRPRKVQDWTALPSVNDAWPAARADLDQRIDALLDAIAAGQVTRR